MGANVANKMEDRDGLLVICMAEHQTTTELEKLKNYIISKAKKHEHEVNVLIDVSKIKTADDDVNTFARTFLKDLPFKHMAVYGGSRVVNVGIRLILNLFSSPGVGEVKLFKTEEKARAWLALTR